jgi:hypothetical protein
VSGTIKRQKGYFVRVESTTNFIETFGACHSSIFLVSPYVSQGGQGLVLLFQKLLTILCTAMVSGTDKDKTMDGIVLVENTDFCGKVKVSKA